VARETVPGLRAEWRAVLRYIRFALPLVPADAAYWILSFGDRVLIAHSRSLVELGAYAAAYRVAQLLSFVYAPISFVLLPLLAWAWSRGHRDLARAQLRRFSYLYLVCAIPACFALIRISPVVIRTLVTADMNVPWGNTALLIVAVALLGAGQIWSYALYLKGSTRTILLIYASTAALNVGINVLLIPRMGATGAAVSSAFTYGVLACWTYRSASQIFGALVQFSHALLVLGSGTLAYVLLFWWNPDTVTGSLLWALSFASLYVGLLLLACWRVGGFRTMLYELLHMSKMEDAR
jgi:O-antigen/teichoic acid export membrane protein